MNRLVRIYHPGELSVGAQFDLTENASHHVLNVLRMKLGQNLALFDGKSATEYQAEITGTEKKRAQVKILSLEDKQVESPLKIFLGQAVSRGERMDFTLQKSVELGVYEITPLFTERCRVDLQGERLAKKIAHWQQVVIAACEQSGRCYVPIVKTPLSLKAWLGQLEVDLSLVADPCSSKALNDFDAKIKTISLLCGPEGGLSEKELKLAEQYKTESFAMGPRVLRTETAALTAISLMQQRWGDFH